MRITPETTFGEILRLPGMTALKGFLFSCPSEHPAAIRLPSAEELSGVSIADFCPPGWSAEQIAYGLNGLSDCVSRGSCSCLPLYDEEARRADPTLERTGLLHFSVGKKAPFAILCAGGAYQAVANLQEAFPAAVRLNSLGIHAFVLQYRTGVRNCGERALSDLRSAIHYIFSHAEALSVAPDYAVFGFSAGGHLTAELGSENLGWHTMGVPKPEALVLSYPLVNDQPETEQLKSCWELLLPEGAPPEQLERYIPLKHIGPHFPRTYLWQTAEDEQVAYTENGLALKKALDAAGIPAELRTIPHGLHGLGIGMGTEADGWLEEAVRFWMDESQKQG